MTLRMLRATPISVRVGAVVAVVSLAAFFVTSHATDQQEGLVLQSDTTHAAALTSAALHAQVMVLDSLATNVTITGASPTGFLTGARPLVHGAASAALAKAYLTHFVIFASVGPAMRTGQELPDAIAIATHVAGASASPGPAVIVGGQGTADLAVGAPLIPDGNIVALHLLLRPLLAATVTGPSFADIRVALYGSTRPAANNLLASESGDAPLLGPVASAPVRVGSETWTLVAGARRPLIGDFAAHAPLIVFLLGLFVALSSGVIVQLVVRRRRPVPVGLDRGMWSALGALATPPESDDVAPLTASSPVANGREGASAMPSGPSPNPDDMVHADDDKSSPHGDWRPDPFGRFESRRFFLDAPTSVVKNGATEGYDPVAPLLEQGGGASESTPKATESPPLQQQADDALNVAGPAVSSERPSGDNPSDQGNAASQPAADTPEALKTMATGVGQAIADEIDELRVIASKIGEYSANRLSETSAPEAPPAIQEIAPSGPVEDARHSSRRHEPAKSLAVASGLLGVISLLWRRRRKRHG